MTPNDLTVFLRRLIRGINAEAAEESDADLVNRYRELGDPLAFETLVHRHGLMVYRVCRGITGRPEDAEDAFQATFLVLTRNAWKIRSRASLASWLHGVARRVALKALARAAAERRREGLAAAAESRPAGDSSWDEVRTALDEEIARLPEQLRQPVVLCFLEGRTHDEAAGSLGWSKSTLRRRLEEARAQLASRLDRRGVRPESLMPALQSVSEACSSVPLALLNNTISSLTSSAVFSLRVIELTKGVVAAMWIKNVLVGAVMFVLIVAGVSVTAQSAKPEKKPAPRKTEMVPLDKLKDHGITYDPAEMNAPVHYKEQMLILVGADGAAAVVFGKEDAENVSVEYRYRYQSRDGKQQLSGTATVKGSAVADIKAGPLTIGWSHGSPGRGWVYYNLNKIRVHLVHSRWFDDRVEDLIPPFPDGRKVTWPKVDLQRFMKGPQK